MMRGTYSSQNPQDSQREGIPVLGELVEGKPRSSPGREHPAIPEPQITDHDPRAHYYAIEDACWIYQYRDLEQNLQRLGWREARRRVLKQGSLSREWIGRRGHKPVRLTRRGLEVEFDRGVETVSWRRMQEAIRARRS